MKTQNFSADGRREREIITGMVFDPAVLGQIAAKWDRKAFESSWCNDAGEFCVQHYRKFKDAPREGMRSYFEDYAARRPEDHPEVQAFGQFLGTVLDSGSPALSTAGTEHLLDMARRHFERVAVRRAAQGALDDLRAGKDEAASARLANFRKVQIGSEAGIHFFTDREEVYQLFEHEQHPLITFTGPLLDLNRFFQGQLEPEGFIALIAPNKSSKSFWLMELGYQAMCQRRRVAYFVVGDMSKRQIENRLATRAAGKPRRSLTNKWPYMVRRPVSLTRPSKGQELATVQHEELIFKEPLDATKAWVAIERVMRDTVKSANSYFYLRCWPNGGANVADIQAELEVQELTNGWVADIVVIDYADNLGPLDRNPNYNRRDQINMTWDALSALRTSRHCLLVTATQGDSGSFNKPLLDKSNFSEDRRKLDHVTGMVGINMTPKEREQGLCRLNWVNVRDGDMSDRQVVHVASCLGLACPAVLATF